MSGRPWRETDGVWKSVDGIRIVGSHGAWFPTWLDVSLYESETPEEAMALADTHWAFDVGPALVADPQDLPFDELNDAIELYEEALRRTYAVRGLVEIEDGLRLVWGKLSGPMVLFVIDNNGHATPLASASMLARVSAAKHLAELEAELVTQSTVVRELMVEATGALQAAAKALP